MIDVKKENGVKLRFGDVEMLNMNEQLKMRHKAYDHVRNYFKSGNIPSCPFCKRITKIKESISSEVDYRKFYCVVCNFYFKIQILDWNEREDKLRRKIVV
jgi:hypothetical protein